MALDKYETAGAWTWTCPAGVRLAGIGCIGGGGGGKGGGANSNGGGGGGAFATDNIVVVPGQTYNLVVGAGGQSDTDGGASSFNATSVIAAGGKKGSTRTGGAVADCTGSTKRAGGNGGAGDAAQAAGGGGGGAAGTSGAGTSGTGALNTTPGVGGVGGGGTMPGGTGGNGRLAGEDFVAPSGYGAGAGGQTGAGTAGSVWIQTNAAPVTIGCARPPQSNYVTGEVVPIVITFDQAVDVTGTPTIDLTFASGVVQAAYASGTGTDTLTFNYTVQSGDSSIFDQASLGDAGRGLVIASTIALAGGTIRSTPLATDANLAVTGPLPPITAINEATGKAKVIFDTAGLRTWKTPATVKSLLVECTGGGGSGGPDDRDGFGGHGGGGGGYATSLYSTDKTDFPLRASYTLFVGSGGTPRQAGGDLVSANDGGGTGFDSIDASPLGTTYAAGGKAPVPRTSNKPRPFPGPGTGGAISPLEVGEATAAGGDGGRCSDTAGDAGGGGGGGGGAGGPGIGAQGDGETRGEDGSPGNESLGEFAGEGGDANAKIPSGGKGGTGGRGGVRNTAGSAGAGSLAKSGGGGGGGAGGTAAPGTKLGGSGGVGSIQLEWRFEPRIDINVGPPAGDYATGQSLGFAVTFDQAVVVTGTPQIALTIGASTRQATYVSGSGASTLFFAYQIVGGDSDTDGIASASVISLNSGTIRSSGLLVTDAILTFTPPTLSGVFVNRAATETITSSQTWTCPAGVTAVDAECWGGGGGGSGGGASLGAVGGGGGAYSKKLAIPTTPGNNYTVTVGAAGAAGTAGNPGTAGGDTSFGVTACVAKGGTGGAGNGAGGAASGGTGDTKKSGGSSGTPGLASGCGGGSSAGTAADGGNGGNSAVTNGGAGGTAPSGGGAGGRGGDTATNASLAAGSAPGGGGGGGSATFTGAAGVAGKVILTHGGASVASSRILRVDAPADDTYFTGANLDFTVVFNEAVTVTGTPYLPLTVGSVTEHATYLSGSGTASLVFRFTVEFDDEDDDGITAISPLVLNGGTILNASAIAATLTFTLPDVDNIFVNFFDPAADPASSSTSFTQTGFSFWVCPPGVTTVSVSCWGSGAGGAFASTSGFLRGGGGGAFASKDITVVPGKRYRLFVGSGGAPGEDGDPTFFVAPATLNAAGGTVTAGGKAADCVGSVKRSGGDPGDGSLGIGPTSRGGGGGSSAGPSNDGNPGSAAPNDGTGGAAVTGGGKGGDGAKAANGSAASEGGFPGGGGGGGAPVGVVNTQAYAPGKGANGKVTLTWTPDAPVIVSASAGPAGSSYDGATIFLTLTFDQNVSVQAGVPSVSFAGFDGKGNGTSRSLVYTSGTGTPTLRFEYEVLSAQTDFCASNIVIASTITLNGATIQNQDSKNASVNFIRPSPSKILLNYPIRGMKRIPGVR